MITLPNSFHITVSCEPAASGPEKYVAESEECSVRTEGHTAASALTSFVRRLERGLACGAAVAEHGVSSAGLERVPPSARPTVGAPPGPSR